MVRAKRIPQRLEKEVGCSWLINHLCQLRRPNFLCLTILQRELVEESDNSHRASLSSRGSMGNVEVEWSIRGMLWLPSRANVCGPVDRIFMGIACLLGVFPVGCPVAIGE